MPSRVAPLLCLLALLACDSPKPQPSRPATVRVAPKPQTDELVCPGGLLCEAKTPLLGWRIPVGCEPEITRPRVQACWLPHVAFDRIAEFFHSRYRVEATPEGMTVHSLRVFAPGVEPPLLQVSSRPEGVELVALAGGGTDATP